MRCPGMSVVLLPTQKLFISTMIIIVIFVIIITITIIIIITIINIIFNFFIITVMRTLDVLKKLINSDCLSLI